MLWPSPCRIKLHPSNCNLSQLLIQDALIKLEHWKWQWWCLRKHWTVESTRMATANDNVKLARTFMKNITEQHHIHTKRLQPFGKNKIQQQRSHSKWHFNLLNPTSPAHFWPKFSKSHNSVIVRRIPTTDPLPSSALSWLYRHTALEIVWFKAEAY